MPQPLNPEVYSSIKHGIADSFYGTIIAEAHDYAYGKLTKEVQQDDLTVTYTAWGGAPEPRQLSAGATGAGGGRQAKALKDYKLVGTVVEWEQTISLPRSIVETQPGLAAEKAAEMARKAMLFMDRRFVATILPAATAGYDGLSLYNDAHLESGTAQDNNLTSAAATGTKPNAGELESELDLEISTIKKFTDDAGTPVGAATKKWKILVPSAFEYMYGSVVNPAVNNAIPGYDSSANSVTTSFGAGSGRFRGMIEVIGSPFIAADDRHYIFADRPGYFAVALLKNKDFEVVDNINTDSDEWRLNQTALIHSYARFEFIPWDWKGTIRQVWT
jgi:hypothetical protein